MTWILTNSGVEFDLRNPTPEMVNLSDIAHALSNIKRFNGHTGVNCSVALHCVILSYAVPDEYARQALLHDAHEAYLGDISSPVKELLGPQLKALERGIDAVISKRLKVSLMHNSIVHLFDLRHLKYEKELFLKGVGKPWPCLSGIHALTVPHTLVSFYGETDCYLHARLFLARCEELGVCDV